jgi:hypothetical protein
MRHRFAFLFAAMVSCSSAAMTAPMPDNGSPEAQGHADRVMFEAWIAGLSGDQRRGADFWAAERSKPKPASCMATAPSPEYTSGCQEAQRRLTSFDVRRKSEPDYRKGWNAPVIETAAPGPIPTSTPTPTPPQVQGGVRATTLTLHEVLDCFAKCQVALINSEKPPPGLPVPVKFSDLLKVGSWKARFLQMLGDLPPEFMAFGVLKPGEYQGLYMSGSLIGTISSNGQMLYIYTQVGYPKGLPSREPNGLLDVVIDPKDGKMAGIWNGPQDLSQFRFLGSADKLAPLLAYLIASDAELERADQVSQAAQPAPVILPLPDGRVTYTRARLDYLGSLLVDGEINGAHSPFYAGDQVRKAQDALKPKWYAIELNRQYCIDGLSPAKQIEMIRDNGYEAHRKDTTDSLGKLVKVEISYDEGITTITRTAFTSMKACEEDLKQQKFIPQKYR